MPYRTRGFVPERDKPEWWNRARRLELANKLKEAEQAIKDGVPHASFAYATATSIVSALNRLAKSGDATGARNRRQGSRRLDLLLRQPGHQRRRGHRVLAQARSVPVRTG